MSDREEIVTVIPVAVRHAAEDLFTHMGEACEDALEDLWLKARPDFVEFLDHCTSEELEAWQEPIFRQVMAELAAMCGRRADGETP